MQNLYITCIHACICVYICHVCTNSAPCLSISVIVDLNDVLSVGSHCRHCTTQLDTTPHTQDITDIMHEYLFKEYHTQKKGIVFEKYELSH